jgi:hypothetical protein
MARLPLVIHGGWKTSCREYSQCSRFKIICSLHLVGTFPGYLAESKAARLATKGMEDMR